MGAVTRYTVSDDGWTELSDGSATVDVQVLTAGRVEFTVATSDPGSSNSDIGVLIENGQAWPFRDLGGTDKVYGRAKSGDETVAVYAS